MSLFSATDLGIRFGGIRAVEGVSFEVRPGEVFSIIGPNGAGKTTIFNLISRIYNPTSGRLTFNGQDITETPPHLIAGLGIARTFQNIELFANATLLQNLLIGRHCHSKAGLLSQFGFLPSVRRAEVEHRKVAEEVIAPRLAAPSRQPDRQSALRGAQGGGTRAGIVHGAQAAAAR